MRPEDSRWSYYDSFGREVRAERYPITDDEAFPIDYSLEHISEYDQFGNLMSRTTYHCSGTNEGLVVCTNEFEYDWKGRCIREINPVGAGMLTSYDDFDRATAISGATYPVQYDYDTDGRTIVMRTTRDGEIWDETRWTYDHSTGLCTSKRHADGSIITYSHTPDGLPLRTTYPSVKWKECVYDARRNFAGMVYSSPSMGYEIKRKCCEKGKWK